MNTCWMKQKEHVKKHKTVTPTPQGAANGNGMRMAREVLRRSKRDRDLVVVRALDFDLAFAV